MSDYSRSVQDSTGILRAIIIALHKIRLRYYSRSAQNASEVLQVTIVQATLHKMPRIV